MSEPSSMKDVHSRIVRRRIVLVRHGPSRCAVPRGLIDRQGFERWRVASDRQGIRAEAFPPTTLVELASRATRIVASDLPRALESAYRLAATREVEPSALV